MPSADAAVSWSDIPESDGRRIWIGWMSNWQYAQDVPTSPWRSATTVPRTLSLRETADGYRLLQSPVKDLDKLRASTEVFAGGSLQAANEWLKTRTGHLLDVEVAFENAKGTFSIQIAGAEKSLTEVRVSGPSLSLDRRRSGLVDFHAKFPGHHVAPIRQNEDGAVSVRLLIDTSSIEAFANGGEGVITDLIFPTAGDYRLSLSTVGGVDPPSIKSIRFSKLKSAW